MLPGGEVADVRIVQSSGNEIFDRQAEAAVKKASPLPVPADPRLFEKVREINFIFAPED
jgi:colicin import membrane protein